MDNNTSQVKKFFYIILALVVVLVIFVLVRKDKNKQEEYEIGMAMVDDVEVTLKESFPVGVDVLVNGNLPDGCTSLGDTKQSLVGNTFNIRLETRKLKDGDVMCTQALVPFKKNISLENVVGISAGEYTVDVNGVKKTFVMDVDNYITDEDPLK